MQDSKGRSAAGDHGPAFAAGVRGWHTWESVELVEDPKVGLALAFTPARTARGLHPEWFDEDYRPPLVVVTERELRPRDPPARDDPGQADDRDLLRKFLGLTGGRHGPKTLEEFTSKRADRVLKFARTYGPLHVCDEHSLPITHAVGFGRRSCHEQNPEPLSVWWDYARKVDAVVRLAGRLRDGKRGSDEQWGTLLDRAPEEVREARRAGGLSNERADLARWVEWWLNLAAFRSGLRWGQGEEPRLVLLDPSTSPVPLFAALARQLVLTVCGAADVEQCDGCGRPYQPARRPRAGENHYCPNCRENGIPARDAMRRYRRREREKSS